MLILLMSKGRGVYALPFGKKIFEDIFRYFRYKLIELYGGKDLMYLLIHYLPKMFVAKK